MQIGVPKEIKNNENRVGLTDAGVAQLVAEGHSIYVETGAGLGSGISDMAYVDAGASIGTQDDVWASDMVIKVKEPLPGEYHLLRDNQLLYAYLHLAAEPHLAQHLREAGVQAVGYETIQMPDGTLPLLTPMSEVAGRMATQVGAFHLQCDHGGKGVLLGGVTGVQRGRVTIIGCGVVGMNATKVAVGMGADVTVIDINRNRLEYVDHVFQGRVQTLYSNPSNIARAVASSDLVIGAVLLPGAKAPVLVTEPMIQQMAPGSVVVDVAVDQGGCVETCHPTSHETPTYTVNGVIHYCVPNMPGVVAQTSTYALTNATLRYASLIAAHGLRGAIERAPELVHGVNVYGGFVAHRAVAEALGTSCVPF